MLDFEDIQEFVRKFNRYEGRTATENFLYFYSAILSSFTNNQPLHQDVLSVIQTFVERIRILDDLIDNEGLYLDSAFSWIFPELNNHFLTIEKRSGTSANSEMKYLPLQEKSECLRREAEKIMMNHILDVNNYNLTVAKALERIYRYGQLESVAFSQGIAKVEELENLLINYNCDFYLYNDIVFDVFPLGIDCSEKFSVRRAFSHYLVIDGILDSFCDLFDDLRGKSFNFLACFLKNSDSINIREFLFKKGVYSLFYKLTKKNFIEANLALSKISNLCLRYKLELFLEGAWQGLSIAQKNDYFVDSDPFNITPLEQLLYKPHPWEIIDGMKVIEKYGLIKDSI